MYRHLKTVSISLLLFLIFLPSLALSQTAVGKFTFVQGRVDVLRQPAPRAVPVKMGNAVFVGDIIRAKSASKAEITFNDGNIVRVAPNTRVEISEYMFEEAKGKGILKLSRGKVQAIIQEKIAKRIATFGEANRFEIHTPTAIAGARGCNFIVSFQRNSSSVLVLEGAVLTYNPKFPDMAVTVNAGYITTIPFDQPVQPARPATDAEKKMYEGDFAPGGSGEKSEAEDTVISEATTGSAEPGATEPGSESSSPTGNLTETPQNLTEIVQPPPITETAGTDTIPPVINITGPPDLSNLPVSSFNVTSDETVTFTYQMESWGAISSNTTSDNFNLEGLPDGTYILTVTATDQAGNSSTVNYTWTVDTTKPFVETAPESPSGKTTAEFGFNETVKYTYTLDGGGPISGTGSSIIIKNLTEGTHEIEIISATDLADNSMTTYEYDWLTDSVPPEILSLTPVAASPEAGATATVTIDLESSETVTYSYRLNGGDWTDLDPSFNILNVPEGSNLLEVQATDLVEKNSPIEQLSFELSRYSLSGSFYGCIAGVYGVATGEIAGVSDQDWGGWIIDMNGSGGSPNLTWTVSAGGRSSDNIESNNNGYWLLVANGATNYESQTLSGTSTLKYLSFDRIGIGEGIFSGNYYEGESYEYTLQDVGSGTYTEKPLDFSGYWGGDSLYRNEEGYFSYAGYDYGLIGLALRPDNNYDLLSIGEYNDYGYGTAYLWNSDFYADAVDGDGQGRVIGFSGGIWKNGTMDGAAEALYIDPDGNAGYLTGAVSGSYYPNIIMWMAEGTLAPTQRATGLNPEDLQTEWGYLDAHLVGDFNDSGSIEGWTGYGETSAYGKTLFFIKDSESLPWGIYNLKLGSGNIFSDKPAGTANWSAMIGGQGTFSYEGDNGYWLAKVEGTWSDDGEIRGDLINGKYLTPTQMGTIGGPFFGINCYSKVSETWIGESIGTWSGEPLAFGGSLGNEFFEWDTTYYLVGVRSLTGLIGATGSLWTGTPSFLSLGTYDTYNLYDGALWGVDVSTNVPGGFISDGGALLGLTGGIVLADNKLRDSLVGGLRAIYIRPTGTEEYEAGYIVSNNVNGYLYPEIGMYELDGNLTAVSMGTTSVSPYELYWGSEYLNTGKETGTIEGDITGVIGMEHVNLTDQDWAIWWASAGGTFTDPLPPEWEVTISFENAEEGYLRGARSIVSQISDNGFAGSTTGYFADIRSNPYTAISVGEVFGTFDPNAYTWQAVSMGAGIETNKFLEMTATVEGQAKLQQMNIPCVEVGRASLTGSGNNFSNLNMTDTIFFAPSTGAKPTIWATGNVNGSYSSAPAISTPIGLSGGGLNADFTFKQWDASNNKWLSSVNGTGGFNGSTSFQGAGAGTLTNSSGAGTISGTAAGVAR